jgi:DNA polymerase I
VNNNILLLDSRNLLYRSFYSLKDLKSKKGVPTGAIFGFCKTFLSLAKKFKPESILIFDDSKKLFRKSISESYKSNRKQTPCELISQIDLLKEFLEAIKVNIYSIDGLEADDLIVHSAKDLSDRYNVVVVTSDKDMQFLALSDNIQIFDPKKNTIVDKVDIESKFGSGVSEEKIWLYYSLCGDKSDDVVGVPGVGDKAAMKISSKYDSIDDMYKRIEYDNEASKRLKKSIIENKCSAMVSYELVKPMIIRDKEFIEKIKNFDDKFDPSNIENAYEFFMQYDMNSLVPKKRQGEIIDSADSIIPRASDNFVTLIYNNTRKEELLGKIDASSIVALDTETRGGDPRKCILVGFSICVDRSEAWYFPMVINGKETENVDFGVYVLKKLFFEKKLLMHNATFDIHAIYNKIGVMPNDIFDTMIAAHILLGNQKIGLKELSKTLLGEKMRSFGSVLEYGNYKFFDEVPLEDAGKYAATDARQTFLLYEHLKGIISESQNSNLFDNIEMPLIEVLCDIENTGICCDKSVLDSMAVLIDSELKKTKHEILKCSGMNSFNPMSSKQVSDLLFVKLGLKEVYKTAIKRQSSTNMRTLERLCHVHPIANLILSYRVLFSLLSKYANGLVKYIEPDGRIHTHFQQMNVSTGRLSTINPNLQNIPRDSDVKFSIRSAFIVGQGKKIISLDYSHIELRVLAHITKDSLLCDMFNQNIDIHSKTASEIFSVSIDRVTKEQRQLAKKINFSIIYGLSAYGLSKELNISKKEAGEYIDKYKLTFPLVFSWMDSVKEEAEKNGFVKTLFGRKREIPELLDSNDNVKKYGFRMAVNTIIQGTAAEIVKIGMISVHKFLKDNPKLGGKIVLQIHDEILIEADENFSDETASQCRKIMENAVDFAIPFSVDCEVANCWK